MIFVRNSVPNSEMNRDSVDRDAGWIRQQESTAFRCLMVRCGMAWRRCVNAGISEWKELAQVM